jgi:hypothetical protein
MDLVPGTPGVDLAMPGVAEGGGGLPLRVATSQERQAVEQVEREVPGVGNARGEGEPDPEPGKGAGAPGGRDRLQPIRADRRAPQQVLEALQHGRVGTVPNPIRDAHLVTAVE